MLNLKQKNRFVCSLIAAMLLFVAAASVANARDAAVASPPTPVGDSPATADTPNLIMTQDGNATAPTSQSDQPNLYQAQDIPQAVEDNSTLVIAPQDNSTGADQNNLIAPQTSPSPDFTTIIAACLSLIVASAAVGALVFVRTRRLDQKISLKN